MFRGEPPDGKLAVIPDDVMNKMTKTLTEHYAINSLHVPQINALEKEEVEVSVNLVTYDLHGRQCGDGTVLATFPWTVGKSQPDLDVKEGLPEFTHDNLTPAPFIELRIRAAKKGSFGGKGTLLAKTPHPQTTEAPNKAIAIKDGTLVCQLEVILNSQKNIREF